MTMDSTKSAIGSSEGGHFLCYDWFDPLETGVRTRIRGFIEELLEAELDAVLVGRVVHCAGSHDSPHFQMAPKVSAKTGSSASIVVNRSINGSNRTSGIVGINS
jgi:hypothetical protein